MNRLRQVGRKIVGTVLTTVALAGVAFTPKQINAQEIKKPAFTLKIDDLSHGIETLYNDKLRMTLDSDLFSLRVDKNDAPGSAIKQSQVAVDFNVIKKPDTTLVLGYAGNIAEKTMTGDYGPYVSIAQNIGQLPLIGKSTLKLFELSSFKKDASSMIRGTVSLLSDRVDLAYDLVKGRDNKTNARYFVALHNNNLYLSLGKSGPSKMQAAFTTMNNDDLGVYMLGDYDTETKNLNLSFFNAYGGADKGIYSLAIGRLGTNVFNLPGIEVKRPILTGYLTFGSKTTHGIDIHTEPGKWSVANQLGFSLDGKLAVGAGMSVGKEAGKPVNIGPLIAAYFKPKILGQDMYLEVMLKDGKLSAYSYTQFKF